MPKANDAELTNTSSNCSQIDHVDPDRASQEDILFELRCLRLDFNPTRICWAIEIWRVTTIFFRSLEGQPANLS